MDENTITALAREYAEFTDMSPVDKKNISAICECFLKYTLRRFCLVEKSRLEKLSIFYRAKVYDMVILDKEDVNFLFPDLGKEVEE